MKEIGNMVHQLGFSLRGNGESKIKQKPSFPFMAQKCL